MSREPAFRLIVDELTQSKVHKEKALSHIADLHSTVLKTVQWDERFITGLVEVLTDAEAQPDALDTGIPEIVSKFGHNGGPRVEEH